MDAKELEFIAKRVEAATPAPWVTGSIPWQVWYDGGHGKICRVESTAYDREFIAHARQDVPALLDEVAKLNLQIDEARSALETICVAASSRPEPILMSIFSVANRGVMHLSQKRNDEIDSENYPVVPLKPNDKFGPPQCTCMGFFKMNCAVHR